MSSLYGYLKILQDELQQTNNINVELHYSNTPFAHFRFDFKIMHIYTSYFPYDGQNGTRSSKSNGQITNFLICEP
jgi:hypothetical protein